MVDIKQPIINNEGSPLPPVPAIEEDAMEAGDATAPEMSEDEMRADLNNTMSDLKGKRGAMNAQFYVSKNKIEAAKASLVQAIFDILKTAGVDPTNLESIQAFISQLEQEDPDLLQLFNAAFDALAGSPGAMPDMAGLTGAPGASAPPEMSPEGNLPVGTAGLETDLPLPPNPAGGSMPKAPGVGGKFGNVASAMMK